MYEWPWKSLYIDPLLDAAIPDSYPLLENYSKVILEQKQIAVSDFHETLYNIYSYLYNVWI